ncbi:hypothetical protein C0J52_23505 [Blattella germanica]|nr:hypothetical protein C0J52_23505 [Blattella germanica]
MKFRYNSKHNFDIRMQVYIDFNGCLCYNLQMELVNAFKHQFTYFFISIYYSQANIIYPEPIENNHKNEHNVTMINLEVKFNEILIG